MHAEEIENVETWARNNNLTLNKSQTSEVVFRDTRRKQKATMPPQMSGMARNTSLNILGVTLTANLSASIISEEYWASVHRHFTHYVSYAAMVYAMPVCKLFFTASLWPSCCMLLQLEAD